MNLFPGPKNDTACRRTKEERGWLPAEGCDLSRSRSMHWWFGITETTRLWPRNLRQPIGDKTVLKPHHLGTSFDEKAQFYQLFRCDYQNCKTFMRRFDPDPRLQHFKVDSPRDGASLFGHCSGNRSAAGGAPGPSSIAVDFQHCVVQLNRFGILGENYVCDGVFIQTPQYLS